MDNKEPLIDLDLNIFSTLQLIFLTLKIAGLVDWSWWFVFSPLIIWVLALIVIVIGVLIYMKVKTKNVK